MTTSTRSERVLLRTVNWTRFDQVKKTERNAEAVSVVMDRRKCFADAQLFRTCTALPNISSDSEVDRSGYDAAAWSKADANGGCGYGVKCILSAKVA